MKQNPEPANVNDALVCAISALQEANRNLAEITAIATKPLPPNKALDKLFESLPNIAVAYITMQQAEARVDRERMQKTSPTAPPGVFELISSFTEPQRTAILAACTGSQQKMLLEIFALVPVPMRPPTS